MSGLWIEPDPIEVEIRVGGTVIGTFTLAQGIEAATAAETVELGSVHESPVVAPSDDAPDPCDPSPNSSQDRV